MQSSLCHTVILQYRHIIGLQQASLNKPAYRWTSRISILFVALLSPSPGYQDHLSIRGASDIERHRGHLIVCFPLKYPHEEIDMSQSRGYARTKRLRTRLHRSIVWVFNSLKISEILTGASSEIYDARFEGSSGRSRHRENPLCPHVSIKWWCTKEEVDLDLDLDLLRTKFSKHSRSTNRNGSWSIN